MRVCRALSLTLTALLASANIDAQVRTEDLASLDLVDLMQLDVNITSAARRAQAGADAAAAVFVLTREDIRRSGADSIPELLRAVPGLQVARISNQAWMVTARGFSTRFANKLLVLIDGRGVYTNNFSGVMWEDQHVPLEEIERIEVVRGPGGALWGANAVNGIINIITRSAANARGLNLVAKVSERGEAASLHYGGTVAELGYQRAYLEAIERESFERGFSPWERLQAGWRFDGEHLRLQADVFENEQSEQLTLGALAVFDLQGGAVSAAWRGEALEAGQLDLQSSYNWAQYSQHGAGLARESAIGLDFQFTAARIGRHLLAIGGGYRNLRDDLSGLDPIGLIYAQPRTSQNLWSVYVQDELHFLDDDLRVTLGAKLEGFKYTGDALQPTLRAIWHLSHGHALWAAASTAVRTPARFDLHGHARLALLPGIPAVEVTLAGNPGAGIEHMNAYETGWRWRPATGLSFDLALFEHRYRDLLQALPAPPYFDTNSLMIVQPYRYANTLENRTRGAELAVDWRALPRLRLRGSGSWFHMNHGRVPQAASGPEAFDAERLFAANARIDLFQDIELDLAWRWVGERPAADIPSYDSLNLRLGWRRTRYFEMALAVDNLLNQRHFEFRDERAQRPGAALGRTASITVKWHLGRD